MVCTHRKTESTFITCKNQKATVEKPKMNENVPTKQNTHMTCK